MLPMMVRFLSTRTLIIFLLGNLFHPLSSVAYSLSTESVDDWCSKRDDEDDEDFFDYIVVGSGPGGGVVASRLAQAGFQTLLLEAGPDYDEPVTTVPITWPQSTEDPNIEWAFRSKQSDDAGRDSVLYPRASMIGGCAEHNALVALYSFPGFWDELGDITGDDEFAEDKMRERFERIEKNEYVKEGSKGSKGHGFDGFLSTSFASILTFPKFVNGVLSSLFKSTFLKILLKLLDLPPNYIRDINAPEFNEEEGFHLVPSMVSPSNGNTRSSVYELIMETKSKTDTMTIRPNSFVTKLLLEPPSTLDGDPIAYGVEVQEGEALYEASTGSRVVGESKTYYARKEVIVAGGTFNTPQLLQLSGIGPRSELEVLGIAVAVDSPGVGSNLRDKIETTLNYKLSFELLPQTQCTYLQPTPEDDPCYLQFKEGKLVPDLYGFPGSILAIQMKSDPSLKYPDMNIGLLATDFRGYNEGWVERLEDNNDIFTMHMNTPTINTGTVTLQSTDPFEVVAIDFNGYDDKDLERSATVVEKVRKWMKALGPIVEKEDEPGQDVESFDEIKAWISQQGWGHHAIGTAKMGADNDSMAVVDGQFRVRGVESLRVVDASVLPDHPAFFPMISLYMLAEKAAEDIVKDDETISPSALGCSST